MNHNFDICKSKIRKKYYFFIFLISVSFLFVRCDRKFENKDNNKMLFELLSISDTLFKKNQYVEAIRCFNKIIEIDSNIGKVYYQRGICYVKTSKYQKAIDDHLKCIELNYRLENSYFNVGLSYEILFNYPMALFYYKKAYELNINNKKAKERIDFIENLENCLNND